MAAGVLRARAAALGRTSEFEIASAGIAVSPASISADPRAIAATARRGIDIRDHRCRPFSAADFTGPGLILGVDHAVYAALTTRAPTNTTARIAYAMDFAADTPIGTEIPDPWCGGPADYERALDQITRAVDGILSASRRA